jgi:hypothetical protein
MGLGWDWVTFLDLVVDKPHHMGEKGRKQIAAWVQLHSTCPTLSFFLVFCLSFLSS